MTNPHGLTGQATIPDLICASCERRYAAEQRAARKAKWERLAVSSHARGDFAAERFALDEIHLMDREDAR